MIVNYESVLSSHQWYTYEIGQFCSPIVRDILAKCDLAAQLKGNEVGFGTAYHTAPETRKTVTGGNTHFWRAVTSIFGPQRLLHKVTVFIGRVHGLAKKLNTYSLDICRYVRWVFPSLHELFRREWFLHSRYLGVHRVTRPWWQTLTNWSDVEFASSRWLTGVSRTPPKDVVDVTTVGQRSPPWLVNSGKVERKFHLESMSSLFLVHNLCYGKCIELSYQ